VFFNVVMTENGAEFFEIIRFANTIGKAPGFRFRGTGANKVEEKRTRFEIEPIDDDFWEK